MKFDKYAIQGTWKDDKLQGIATVNIDFQPDEYKYNFVDNKFKNVISTVPAAKRSLKHNGIYNTSLLATSLAFGLGWYYTRDKFKEWTVEVEAILWSRMMLTTSAMFYVGAFVESLFCPTYRFLKNIVTPN